MPVSKAYQLKIEAARRKIRTATFAEASPEALRAREDFNYFLEYVVGQKAPEHIREWNRHLITNTNSKCLVRIAGRNTDILAPRGSAKSTNAQAFAAWVIGIHSSPEIRLPIQIIYCSYAIDIARSKSTVIKRIIESDRYKEVFPWILKNPKRWADEHWEINKQWAGIDTMTADFTLSCAGLTGAIASKRSHLIIFDDPIKSAEDIENPEVREKISSNWNNILSKTMFEGARAVGLGTRMRGDDIHVTDFIPAKGWLQIEQSALIEEVNPLTNEIVEKSYWPDMYSTQFLQEEREQDPISFAFQRQNKIVRIKEISIDPTWIRKATPPIHFEKLALGIDLASSTKETSDYTAFVLGGLEQNKVHVLDAVRGRWMGNRDKFDVLLEMLSDWNIIHEVGIDEATNKPIYQSGIMTLEIFIENVAYQASFTGDFEQYVLQEKKLYNLIPIPVMARGDKRQRLLGVTGLLQNGIIYFNEWKNTKRLQDELTNFGVFDHDDMADAFVHMVKGLTLYRPLESTVIG